jgi:cysteine desulfurase
VTRQGVAVHPLLFGGAQERGLRPGTVDASACAGLTEAIRQIDVAKYDAATIGRVRDWLEAQILGFAPAGSFVAGAAAPRLPHVSNIVMPGVASPELVAALDLEGVSVSAGSACSAGTVEPSPVIEAMLGRKFAKSAVRLSLGPSMSQQEAVQVASVFETILGRF